MKNQFNQINSMCYQGNKKKMLPYIFGSMKQELGIEDKNLFSDGNNGVAKKFPSNDFSRIHIQKGSYNEVFTTSLPSKTIIYLDPPYEGTQGYGGNTKEKGYFTPSYLEWTKSIEAPVFISEYVNPDRGTFKEIFSKSVLSNAGGGSYQRKVEEKLFWNGKKLN